MEIHLLSIIDWKFRIFTVSGGGGTERGGTGMDDGLMD